MDSCETNKDHVVRDLRYLKSYGRVSNNQTIYEIAESALALLKEQDEREKRICKAVCDFIRSGISTDTKADQDYVCHEIQKRFIHFERSVSE